MSRRGRHRTPLWALVGRAMEVASWAAAVVGVLGVMLALGFGAGVLGSTL